MCIFSIIPSFLWCYCRDTIIHLHHQFISIALAHHNLYVAVIRRQLRTLARERTKKNNRRRRRRRKRIIVFKRNYVQFSMFELDKCNYQKGTHTINSFCVRNYSYCCRRAQDKLKYVHKVKTVCALKI